MTAAGIGGLMLAGCTSPTLTVIDDNGSAAINLKTGQSESPQLNEKDTKAAQDLALKLKTPVRDCVVIYTDDGADWAGGLRTKNTVINCFPSNRYYIHFLDAKAQKSYPPGSDPAPAINGENIVDTGGSGYGTLQTTATGLATTLPLGVGYAAGTALQKRDKHTSNFTQEQRGGGASVISKINNPQIKEVNVFSKKNR